MKKIVPDPPAASPSPKTAHTDFATCRGTHSPLLAINPGTSLEHVLVHLSTSLTAAMETNRQVCEMASRPMTRLAWATQHSLEICEAMLEALMRKPEPSRPR
ncbi:hypothetical protein ACIP1T_28120 [Pseudomonas japonica]|uniref:hypothetical protein n=1 Tax=Pseudomonas japonica TaxID=256466 RepID=UPI0038093880